MGVPRNGDEGQEDSMDRRRFACLSASSSLIKQEFRQISKQRQSVLRERETVSRTAPVHLGAACPKPTHAQA